MRSCARTTRTSWMQCEQRDDEKWNERIEEKRNAFDFIAVSHCNGWRVEFWMEILHVIDVDALDAAMIHMIISTFRQTNECLTRQTVWPYIIVIIWENPLFAIHHSCGRCRGCEPSDSNAMWKRKQSKGATDDDHDDDTKCPITIRLHKMVKTNSLCRMTHQLHKWTNKKSEFYLEFTNSNFVVWTDRRSIYVQWPCRLPI